MLCFCECKTTWIQQKRGLKLINCLWIKHFKAIWIFALVAVIKNTFGFYFILYLSPFYRFDFGLICTRYMSDHNQRDQINCCKFNIQLNWPKMVTNAKVNQKETNQNVSTQKQERKKKLNRPRLHTHTHTQIYRARGTAVEAKIPNKLRLFARPMEVQWSSTSAHTHTLKHQSHTPVGRVALNETAAKNCVMDYFDAMFQRLAG